MKLKKIDAAGFTHGILLMAFVVIFAISGAAYVVATHANAAPAKPAPSGGAGLGANPNPNNCNTKTFKNIAMPTGKNRGLLNDYFADKTLAGKLSKDHWYTLKRADAAQAKNGYCYQSSEGYAYRVKVTGTVPLLQYWNGSHHYYTIDASTAPAGYKKTAIVAYVSPTLTGHSEFGYSTVFEGEYQFLNAGTDGAGPHYFYTVDAGLDTTHIAALQKLGYNETSTSPVFYVWRDTNVVAPKKTATTKPAAPATKCGAGEEKGDC